MVDEKSGAGPHYPYKGKSLAIKNQTETCGCLTSVGFRKNENFALFAMLLDLPGFENLEGLASQRNKTLHLFLGR